MRTTAGRPRAIKQLVRRAATRVLGPKFVKHYVRPRQVGKSARPYSARAFFESWHAASAQGVSDAETIAADRSPLETRYHYNEVENAIIGHLAGATLPPEPSVLDVGSGAGHWIDFYRALLGAGRVVGVELSESGAEALRARYEQGAGVDVVCADVSSPDFDLGERFDLVNAIGVMFHIVEDEAWERAIANLAAHLAPGGRMLVGGQFGLTTRNVQFHHTDEFASWDEFRAARSGTPLVNKRIRSLRTWRRAAAAAGLRVVGVRRTRGHDRIEMPENNVLLLVRAD